MEYITLQGDDSFLTLTFDEVYGFPKTTCTWGGYEVKTALKIKAGHFQVNAVLFTSTGELYLFLEQLKACNSNLAGTAEYRSYEGNLELTATYDAMGHVNIKGHFIESFSNENELKFAFSSDQSYISYTIQDLERIAEKYGDMHGINH